MGVRFSTRFALCLAVFLGLLLALQVAAKDSKTKAKGVTNLQGRVHMIDKESSTITVDTKPGPRRLVVFGPNTKFKYGHSSKGKDSSLDQVRETNYISCSGTYDEKMRLVATECVHRESK